MICILAKYHDGKNSVSFQSIVNIEHLRRTPFQK